MHSTTLRSHRSRGYQALAGLGIAAVLSALVGCGRGKQAAVPTDAPIEVGVVTVRPGTVTLTQELPGRVTAFRVAEVRARVSGIVLKRHFEEGTDVKEGDVLYQIDPAPYQAALDSAIGMRARAEANETQARLQAERIATLLKGQAVSQQDFDNAVAAQKAAEAEVASSRAAEQTATINLGYTRVVAPLTGRIGRSEVTEGAYVQQGAATLLATIQQLDPVYVDMTQSSTAMLRIQRALAAGKLHGAAPGEAVVRLLLEDGTPYEAQGKLQFTDVTVNPSTGSVRLRALFPNPSGFLLPGMFVRAQVEEGQVENALLVPQPAVSRTPRGEGMVYVVGADGKAEMRTLATERTVGDKWLVTSGIREGDQIIVDRLQRIRPGAAVKPVAPAGAGGASPVAAGASNK